MYVMNGSQKFKFNLIEFPQFVGRKIQYNGAPIFSISDDGKFGFIETELLYDSINKLSFFLRLYAKWVVKKDG